jgi:hypothetical protein
MQEAEERRGFDDRATARNTANNIRTTLTAGSPYTAQGIEGILLDRALHGIDDAYDATAKATITPMLRQSWGNYTPDVAEAYQDLANERMKATSGVRKDAAVQALGLSEDLNNAWTNRNSGLYSLFANEGQGRGLQMPNSVTPNISTAATSRANFDPQATAMISSLANMQTPQLSIQDPNYSTANFIKDTTNSLAGLFQDVNMFGRGNSSSNTGTTGGWNILGTPNNSSSGSSFLTSMLRPNP